MSVANSDTYQSLYGQILDINPETQRLKDICRVFLDQDFESKASLLELAFAQSEGRNVEQNTSDSLGEVGGDEDSDDHVIGNLTNLRELPKLLKKQFLMPDEIFFHRLIRNDLFILKKEKRQRRLSWEEHLNQQSQLTQQKAHLRQRSYILMDVSASTSRANRLTIEKAIAIAFLETHQMEGGEVWLRTFNQRCSQPWLAKDGVSYRRLINKGIVTAKPVGQTDLQEALKTALSDLDSQPSEDRAEILLLTDGLAPLDLDLIEHSLKLHRVHVVLIGGDRPDLSDSELKDRFMSTHSKLVYEMENSPDRNHRERVRSRLDQMYRERKSGLKEDLMLRWRRNLEACAKISGGVFLHIPDLPPSSFSIDAQLDDLEERIKNLERLLTSPTATSLEKEQLIDELLAIRAFVQELKEGNADPQRVANLMEATKKLTLSSEELQTMLKHAQIRWNSSRSQDGESVDFLLFLKVIRESIRRWVKGKEKS